MARKGDQNEHPLDEWKKIVLVLDMHKRGNMKEFANPVLDLST